MSTHVVVTCSKRKRQVGGVVRLADTLGRTIESRAEAWVERLRKTEIQKVQARKLYLGEQWALLRELEATSDRRDATYWILSAGYGLVPFDALLRPYSATFSQDHPDSVFDSKWGLGFSDAVARWWAALSRWSGPSRAPRSLTALVKQDPEASLLVAASPVYLSAIEADLRAASSRMTDSSRLLVFSGGRSRTAPAIPLLHFDGRLQNRLGGSLMALNARVMAAVLEAECTMDQESVQLMLDRWSLTTTKREQPIRRPMRDSEVRSFLKAELRRDPTARWTPLLRTLRDEGKRACEQKRFRALFKEVSGQLLAES